MSLQALNSRPAALASAGRSSLGRGAALGCPLPLPHRRGAVQATGRGTRPLRKPASSSAAVTAPAPAPAETTTGPSAASPAEDGVWPAFAAAVSGEWEGVTASFEPDGRPIPLPEYYVPEAYRDWGVELFDWQSQSSVLADDAGLTATSRRMMPTVGCEADAIAYTQQAAQLFHAASGCATVAPDGSYSAGPLDITDSECYKAAFEHCLVLPAGASAGAAAAAGDRAGQRMRVKLVHNLRKSRGDGAWGLQDVELHLERYDSPYRGKLELSGCGGGLKGFAAGEALPADALAGDWVVSRGLRYRLDPASGECSCSPAAPRAGWTVGGLLPAGQAPVLYPLRAWSACCTGSAGSGNVTLSAGVLLDEAGSRMAVSTRRLQGGRTVGVELLVLERPSA